MAEEKNHQQRVWGRGVEGGMEGKLGLTWVAVGYPLGHLGLTRRNKAKGHLGLTWVAAGDPRQQTRTFGSRAIHKCRPAMSNFPGVTTCVDPLFSSTPSSQLYKCRPVTYLVTGENAPGPQIAFFYGQSAPGSKNAIFNS